MECIYGHLKVFPKLFNLTLHLVIVKVEINDVEKLSTLWDPGGPCHVFGNPWLLEPTHMARIERDVLKLREVSRMSLLPDTLAVTNGCSTLT